MVMILAGMIRRVDAERRIIGIGRNDVWVPRHIPLVDIVGSDVVSAVCEERDGRFWMLSFRSGLGS